MSWGLSKGRLYSCRATEPWGRRTKLLHRRVKTDFSTTKSVWQGCDVPFLYGFCQLINGTVLRKGSFLTSFLPWRLRVHLPNATPFKRLSLPANEGTFPGQWFLWKGLTSSKGRVVFTFSRKVHGCVARQKASQAFARFRRTAKNFTAGEIFSCKGPFQTGKKGVK